MLFINQMPEKVGKCRKGVGVAAKQSLFCLQCLKKSLLVIALFERPEGNQEF
jgi:hypothetical protein